MNYRETLQTILDEQLTFELTSRTKNLSCVDIFKSAISPALALPGIYKHHH